MSNTPTTTATPSAGTERRITAREAYERGASVEALKKWFHLSDSEAQDVAPEEFEDETERNGMSGY